jgi:hypothetical protein
MAMGIARKKIVPNQPDMQAQVNSTPLPSWLQGEAPQAPPRRKKPRVDSGGQLVKGSMRAA